MAVPATWSQVLGLGKASQLDVLLKLGSLQLLHGKKLSLERDQLARLSRGACFEPQKAGH
jgi:hypothetical protein